jgi:hypothetical protein
VRAVLRIRDPVLFYPLDPVSGSGMNFFPDPGSRGYDFKEISLNYLKNSCSFLFLLIRLTAETIRSKKKVGFIFHPFFMYSRIRDENFWDPDPGSVIKHPDPSTLGEISCGIFRTIMNGPLLATDVKVLNIARLSFILKDFMGSANGLD